MLELFEGKINLTEIMELEIPLVNELMEAKERLIKEKEKVRLKQEQDAANAAKAGQKKQQPKGNNKQR